MKGWIEAKVEARCKKKDTRISSLSFESVLGLVSQLNPELLIEGYDGAEI